jgi:hypothetical protein
LLKVLGNWIGRNERNFRHNKAFVSINGNKLSSNPCLTRKHLWQAVSNMLGVGFVRIIVTAHRKYLSPSIANFWERGNYFSFTQEGVELSLTNFNKLE